MTHLKRKLMMTLALLLTAVTGAWAESKPIGLNVEYAVGDVITTNSTGDVYVWWGIYSTGGENYEWVIKITSSVTPTISELGIDESSGSIKLDKDYSLYDMNGNIAASSYSIQCQGKVTGTTLEKVYVASGSGTLTDPYVFAPGPAAPAATPVPLTWDAATPNTATLTNGMPAGNVTVSVEYFPQAEFAMSTGETPVALAPTAIADVPATTDGPIVTPGTVKNIGTSEVKQGTLMYYVSTTEMTDDDLLALTPDKWSADVPTATDLAQGAAYVYYYIKGAEPATIAERTDANTCSDGDILAANVVNVTLGAAPLWNAEFDLTNAPEEDKAPGVWSTDIPEGGVVKGTPVKVTYTGTKKVLGVNAAKKKAAEGHALTSAKFGEIVCSDGKAYAAADKDNLPNGVKAEALVCYASGEHGLALAMVDVKNAKMSWDNERGANDGKTAAEWCTGWNTSHPITGATWLLASRAQWNVMIDVAGSANINLSNAFSAVGGTNLQADSYWSSTTNVGASAWRYHFPSSSWSWTYLNQDNTGSYIRACLEW